MENFGKEIAHLMSLEELGQMFDDKREEKGNPAIKGLVFVETREHENHIGGVFPCIIESVGRDEKTNKVAGMVVMIIQCNGGDMEGIKLRIGGKNVDVKYRFWSLPPTDEARAAYPFVDGVKQ